MDRITAGFVDFMIKAREPLDFQKSFLKDFMKRGEISEFVFKIALGYVVGDNLGSVLWSILEKIKLHADFLGDNLLVDNYTLGVFALKEVKSMLPSPRKDKLLSEIKDKYFGDDNRKSFEIAKLMSAGPERKKALKQVVDSFLKISDKENALEAVQEMMSSSQKDKYFGQLACEFLASGNGVEAFSCIQGIGSIALQQQVLEKFFPGIDLP